MKLFRSLTMTARFNLLNVALILLTAMCVGFIVAYTLLTRQFEARQEYNQALANLLAETSEYAVYTHQNAFLESQLARLKNLPGLAAVTIQDDKGQTLAELRLDHTAGGLSRLDKESGSLNFWRWWVVSGGQGFNEITQAISSKGFMDEEALFLDAETKPKVIGQVRIAMNLAYFEDILINTFTLALAVVMFILAISLGFSLMMTARITFPLKQLGAAAHDIIGGQLTPVTLKSGGPELRELGQAFNLMSNWLRDYQNEVRSYQTMLERQAFYDDLTGLANRTLLKDHLKAAVTQAHRRQTSAAVMFLDLDRFKYVNDTLGHSFGDNLLQNVAKCLRRQLRACDTVARMGGDEFIIILNDLSRNYDQAKQDVSHVAHAIGEGLSRPFSISGHEISTSFSIGIAIYPHDGDNGEILTRNADCAMYEAKGRGRNTYRFYDPSLQQRGIRRLNLENGLKRALEQNELSLHFQPKYNAQSGKLVGAEALLRWQFKDCWVPPAEFVPLAEETGLILPIGEWVLETALAAMAVWRQTGVVSNDFHVGVNVAPPQFWHPNFAKRTLEILSRLLPDAPGCLELELTESCLLRPTDESQRTFSVLRNAGLRFAVDDFGTGYSNLSYLKQFPLDALKIDQSFVRDCIDDPSDATIIRAIIAMARGLGLDVIAEGVESIHHADFLHHEGCHLLQGYLLAQPMPADAFARFCRQFDNHPIHDHYKAKFVQANFR